GVSGRSITYSRASSSKWPNLTPARPLRPEASPLQLDLDLRAVLPHLDLEREGHLVGDVDRVADAVADERDLVVACQLVGQVAQPPSRRLPLQALLGDMLDQAHRSSFPRSPAGGLCGPPTLAAAPPPRQRHSDR